MKKIRSFVTYLLNKYKVPVKTWGSGTAKTFDHLISEIESGEAYLQEIDGNLVRVATGSTVNVFYGSGVDRQLLVETKQVFRDGRERTRKLESSIGEKIGPKEKPIAGAKRALREELRFSESQIKKCQLVAGEIVTKGPVKSDSYPGLMTLYFIHTFTLELPKELYQKDGYVEKQKDKTNYYKWRKVG